MAVLAIGDRSFWSCRSSASSVLVWSDVSVGGAATGISAPEASTQVFHCATLGPSLVASPLAADAMTARSAGVKMTSIVECHFSLNIIAFPFSGRIDPAPVTARHMAVVFLLLVRLEILREGAASDLRALLDPVLAGGAKVDARVDARVGVLL